MMSVEAFQLRADSRATRTALSSARLRLGTFSSQGFVCLFEALGGRFRGV